MNVGLDERSLRVEENGIAYAKIKARDGRFPLPITRIGDSP